MFDTKEAPVLHIIKQQLSLTIHCLENVNLDRNLLMRALLYKNFQPENIPVPDHRIIQMIRYSLKEDVDIQHLSYLIALNPVLTAQILGFANSAFFGFYQSVETVSEAVVAMGIDQARNLVLCFSVKEALCKSAIPGFDSNIFWEDALRRGIAARQISVLVKAPLEQAFTGGMMQDIGLLVLFSIAPDKVDRWALLRANLPQKRHEMENELFHTTHDSVGALLAKKWHLPETLVTAIASHHHTAGQNQISQRTSADRKTILSSLMMLADLCNAAFTCWDKAAALSQLKQKAEEFFRLDGDTIESVLSLLPDQVKEISTSLDISTGTQHDFHTVMNQASQKLTENTISYVELTWKLQKSLQQRDEYAAKLEAELDIAREIQKKLQPDIDRIRHVAAFNIPALHLSGDFYDYFEKPDGTICFCLGDVSGKGTSAALLMAKTISLFRCLSKIVDDISHIVSLMNNELYETTARGMFVTFVGGWLDPRSREISLINVGHLPPLLVNEKNVFKILPSAPPLGIMPDVVHVVRKFSLADSRLYLYTDGFTEGRITKEKFPAIEKKLDLDGFLRWLIQSKKMQLDDQMSWIKKRCTDYLLPRTDDLTLMILSGE